MTVTGPAPRPGALIAGVILGLIVVSSLVGQGPDGAPPSSSYSAGAAGAGAYAELLRRFDHPVRRLRGELQPDLLPAGATVVVLDAPGLSRREARRLGAFVQGGGRLVAGGAGAGVWLEEVLDVVPVAVPAGVVDAVPAGDAPEAAGVELVRFAGADTFSDAAGLEPVLADRAGDGFVALAGDVGAGRVVVLADASALHNRLLAAAGADNAGFGLAVAGREGATVAFAEGPHGYGTDAGLAALPFRWRFVVAGLAVAALVWIAARARRFGPPEDEVRPLPPPRRAYVDALAVTLARTRQPVEATEPVRARVRRLLAERAALGPDADAGALRRAAAAAGFAADEIEAVVGGGEDGEAAVLAAGRALARVHRAGAGEVSTVVEGGRR